MASNNSPKQLQNAQVSVFNINSTGPISALGTVQLDSTGGIISGGAGSTQVSIKDIFTSSDASDMDSTNASIGVTIRAGSAAGTEYTDGDVDASISGQAILFNNSTDTLRPVTLTRGLPVNLVAGQSTTVNVSSLAGAVITRSSAADMLVTASTGSVRVHQSAAGDLNVTVAGYSTIATVSTGSVRVHQSTAGDLNVTVAGYSTTVNVSSLGGAVIVRSSAANQLVTAYQSTRSELLVNAADTSTAAPAAGSTGLHVRQVYPTLLSTAFSTIGNNATSATVVSSAAGLRQKVYAYSITSTVQAVNTIRFASSLANHLWNVQLQSFSSGVSGVNLAVSPPSWLFATEAASPLVFKVSGTTGTYHLSFSYFSEA